MIIMIVDHRERELIARLEELGIPYKVRSLVIGDVIVGNFIIELKKGGDLVGSVYDKRLFFQESKMKYTDLKPVLIIYDLKNIYESARNRNVINGVMASHILKDNLVIPLDTIDDIIYVLKRLIKDSEEGPILQDPSIHWSFPKFKDNKERRIAALSCAKNIGYTKSKFLVEKFETLKGVMENSDQIPQLFNYGSTDQEYIDILFKSSE